MSLLDGPDAAGVEQEITEALDALGLDSDAVATALRRHAGDDDPVCRHLQQRLDPDGAEIRIEGCDALTVDYAVINPDGESWTHATAALPWPVLIFCQRADAGDFDAVFPAAA
jgi:hypothetical protein